LEYGVEVAECDDAGGGVVSIYQSVHARRICILPVEINIHFETDRAAEFAL